ncbi:MAG: hypothetical protein ABII12_13105 [Planctomycetota bacterium]|nr:hypothetical protein [Planctomycetota bacterium]
MFGDTMIPVSNAIWMLSMANDIMVCATDCGSHMTIETMRILNRKKTTVPIIAKNGNRYVSKRAIDRALDAVDAFD